MRNNIFALAAIAVFTTLPAYGQIDEVLRQIERSNTTLKALSSQSEADRLAARTGNGLPDPEVEFARLWGTPADIGNRVDIAVSQGFDIATVSGMKARQGRRRSEIFGLKFASERTAILLEAKRLCIELIHCNRLASELNQRLGHARVLADAYARRLASGEGSRPEYNRALVTLSAFESEIALNEVERRAISGELRRLAGGEEVVLTAACFPPARLPADFESWYDEAARRSPALEYARREAELDRREVTLAQVGWLPSFSVGYMREKTRGELYQGVTVGMSIPLWAGAGRVKQAKAAAAASSARMHDAAVQFYGQMRNLYTRASGIEKVAADYHRQANDNASAELLDKALAGGAISLLDYMVEMGVWYDVGTRHLTYERDFQLVLAALTAVEL